MQGQFSLPTVHAVKVKADMPEDFLSGWDDKRSEMRREVNPHILRPAKLRLEASPVDRQSSCLPFPKPIFNDPLSSP